MCKYLLFDLAVREGCTVKCLSLTSLGKVMNSNLILVFQESEPYPSLFKIYKTLFFYVRGGDLTKKRRFYKYEMHSFKIILKYFII